MLWNPQQRWRGGSPTARFKHARDHKWATRSAFKIKKDSSRYFIHKTESIFETYLHQRIRVFFNRQHTNSRLPLQHPFSCSTKILGCESSSNLIADKTPISDSIVQLAVEVVECRAKAHIEPKSKRWKESLATYGGPAAAFCTVSAGTPRVRNFSRLRRRDR